MFSKPVFTNFSNKYGNNRWVVYSNKIQRIVYLYSDLEYANWLKVENNPNIKYYCEQPIRIEVRSTEGKHNESIPDMYLLYKNGTEIIQEIKYEKDLTKETVIRQIETQKRWCMENNYKHEVVTEKSLALNALFLSNLKVLSKIDPLADLKFLEEVKKYISSEPKTLDEISNEMELDFEDVVEHFFSLIKSNEIGANITNLFLGPLTEVWSHEEKISREV